jgi:hypothetical protein
MFRTYRSMGHYYSRSLLGGYMKSYTINLQGFDTLKIGQPLWIPDPAELLRNPTLLGMLAEDVRKYGGELNNYLLDRAPLQNSRKYVYVSTKLQYLTPEMLSISNDDWHCDPGVVAPFNHNIITHILASGSKHISSMTQFFDRSVDFHTDESVLQMNHREFREHLTQHIDEFDIDPSAIVRDRFFTFLSSHPHRAVHPLRPEFRFFCRITESDDPPLNSMYNLKNTMPRHSTVFTDMGHTRNIETHDDSILIYDKY